MKTNVEIDKKLELIREMDSSLKTEEAIIDLALDKLLDSLSRQRLRKMRGTGWEGDLDQMRSYDVPLI